MKHILIAGILMTLMLAAVLMSSPSPLETLVSSLWLIGSGVMGIVWIFWIEKEHPNEETDIQ